MKITKKTRDQAILICAIAASDPDRSRTPYTLISGPLGLGPTDKAVKLAVDAWRHVYHSPPFRNWTQETDAQAEALLQCGWSP